MSSFKILFDTLCAEQALRSTRAGFERDPVDNLPVPLWALAERRAVLAKVNEIRGASGGATIDEITFVRKVEWLAIGHSDYASKYALYAAELADLVPAEHP